MSILETVYSAVNEDRYLLVVQLYPERNDGLRFCLILPFAQNEHNVQPHSGGVVVQSLWGQVLNLPTKATA